MKVEVMRIPKEIEKALEKRVKAAGDLSAADDIVSNFIRENNIEAQEYDYLTGVEIYANPQASADRIREAIRRKGSDGK